MTTFFTRLKINKNQLSKAHLAQLKDRKITYDVFLYSDYQTQETKITSATQQFFSAEGESLARYPLESRFPSWEDGAKDEISAVWIVYADEGKTVLWRGQVKEMFQEGSNKWNVPNIKKYTDGVSSAQSDKPNTKETRVPRIKFSLYARKAGSFGVGETQVGSIGGMVSPSKPSLHFTLMIEDLYFGIWGTDGQPSSKVGGKLISNFYTDYPKFIVLRIDIKPPAGMTRDEFKKRLVANAYKFQSYSLDYSVPDNLGGSVMDPGEYNSSSYIAGLLNSVMGYVPKIVTPGYQIPGWETPVPSSFFRGT
ncbi:hypothetical protein [Hydromonas duriensis]|uniref:Uncharacterized protein n=1 Tax=Hydromonas duriensis TaxID=1527608 RepID=A0A4R6Y4F4_9BURK|nr:hypothetical protein [Hydromonas duriensis]TDR27809.1 hypothetical protein DFR44_13813 [Hydromonas duriensis]